MEHHPKMHRAFGVYGLFFEKNRLLVINKKGGSYTNHYDLPGGSLEDSESLPNALRREFLEETGMKVEIQNIEVTDFCFLGTGRNIPMCIISVSFMKLKAPEG